MCPELHQESSHRSLEIGAIIHIFSDETEAQTDSITFTLQEVQTSWNPAPPIPRIERSLSLSYSCRPSKFCFAQSNLVRMSYVFSQQACTLVTFPGKQHTLWTCCFLTLGDRAKSMAFGRPGTQGPSSTTSLLRYAPFVNFYVMPYEDLGSIK